MKPKQKGKNQREIQITKIRNEGEDVTRNLMGLKRIVRGIMNKHLYASTLDTFIENTSDKSSLQKK